MAATMEKLEKSRVKLSVEIPAETFAKALETAYRKERGRYSVQGFRKGKAPRALIERFYGEDVFFEGAVDELWREALSNAAQEHGIEIVGRPSLSIESIGAGEPLKLAFIVAVFPEVKLGTYKGVEIPKAEATVTDEQVDQEVERARNARVRWVEVSREVAEGDRVIFDFKGKIDGEYFEGGQSEKHTLDIGSKQFIPGFEEAMVGLPQGEERVIQVTFPEDYPTEALAGKHAEFEIFIHEVRERELPEVDDDLAKDCSEFDTLDEWKADIRAQLQEAAERSALNQKRNAAIGAAAQNAEMEIPDEMVEIQIDGMVRDLQNNLAYQGITMDLYTQLTGETYEKLRESMREEAVKRIQNQLTLEAITKAEGITVTDEEVNAKIADLAKMAGKTVEEYESRLTDVERAYIKDDVSIEKTLDFLVANAVEAAEPKKKTAAKKAPAKKAADDEKEPAAKKPAAAAKKKTTKKEEPEETVQE